MGSTTQERRYTLTEAAPLKGANYYRLKTVERDGKASYSSTRLLNFDGAVRLAVYPNPVTDKVSLTGLENGMQVSIFNMQGQALSRQRALGNTMEISMKQLPAAVYQVQVQDATGKPVGSYRIAKE